MVPSARFLSSDLPVGATAVTIAFAFGAPLLLHLLERRSLKLSRLGQGESSRQRLC